MFAFMLLINGHIEILKWLRSQKPPCPWSERVCVKAAYNGDIETLKWLRSQNPPCPWSEYGLHLCCFQWKY
jgi:hypothetical protein